jgi:hypothetical protein
MTTTAQALVFRLQRRHHSRKLFNPLLLLKNQSRQLRILSL